MQVVIDINNIATWPDELMKYLDSQYQVFHDWKHRSIKYEESWAINNAFDDAVKGMRKILSPFYFHGYHCTRLTEDEISSIATHGMQLPNFDLLKIRIEKLLSKGIIKGEIAKLLVKNNDAQEESRENILWFCFFQPYKAGDGVEDFFRYWGGEALYISHLENHRSARILKTIGVPCVIEANVPLKGLQEHFFELNFVKHYMSLHGLEEDTQTDYEGYTNIAITAANIIGIFKYPEERFLEITNCGNWEATL